MTRQPRVVLRKRFNLNRLWIMSQGCFFEKVNVTR